MNASLLHADRLTHLKIVVVGMLGAIAVTWGAVTTQLGGQHSYVQPMPPVAASVVSATDATRDPSLIW